MTFPVEKMRRVVRNPPVAVLITQWGPITIVLNNNKLFIYLHIELFSSGSLYSSNTPPPLIFILAMPLALTCFLQVKATVGSNQEISPSRFDSLHFP